MPRALPSLDSRGLLTDPAQRADLLMAYALVSNFSQSNMYKGFVTSVPWMIQRYGHDTVQLANEMTSRLTQFFKNSFDQATVDVIIQPVATDTGLSAARFDIQIAVVLTEDNVNYSLGRLLSIINNRVNSVRPFERR